MAHIKPSVRAFHSVSTLRSPQELEKLAMDCGTSQQKPLVVVLTGPTAVGKTKASLLLAQSLEAEIISADSVQVYRQLDVGSDKS